MKVNSKSLLEKARAGHYGIVAPDFLDFISARAFIEVAEERQEPIILSFAQAHRHLLSLEEAALIGNYFAKKASVDIVLHLDHGEDFDYIKEAIDLGFSSVMLDASSYPLEENIKRTREVVCYAHAHGVDVEAEIGHVGGSPKVDRNLRLFIRP